MMNKVPQRGDVFKIRSKILIIKSILRMKFNISKIYVCECYILNSFGCSLKECDIHSYYLRIGNINDE